jgi:ketosteroid isomerase-like protein
MLKRLGWAALILDVAFAIAAPSAHPQTASGDEMGVREYIAQWNAAYTGMNAKALAALETPDFELIDRFGHWVKSEGPEYNERLWAMAFSEVYQGKPGPARTVENIRFMAPNVAIVEVRANHQDGVTLDDGTRIPPFWEIDTYTLLRTDAGWRVTLLNIHNQIDLSAEGPGQHVPDASAHNKQ